MASDKNVAKIVKLQEKIKVELKNLIKEAMQSGMSREDVDTAAKEMIQKFLKDNKDVKLEYNKLYKMWERLLYNNFTTMYKISFKTLDRELNKDKISHEVSQALKEVYKSDKVKKESYVFKSNDLIDDKNINASDTPNLKFIRTSAEYGYTQMQIDNYVEKVERTMDKIAQINFVAVNSTGARVSLRNKAEMEVRYQDMLSDLNELKDEKFVIVSQHKDSSLRCACWQGLIYLKDTDGTDVSLKNWHEWNNIKNHIVPKPIGYTKDNQPYYSLKEAMEHGLFSYNCRHRFIKYEPGAKVPKQYPYDPNKESDSSLIDKQMRQIEQNIRRAKERQTLALTPKERKKWQAKSKKLQSQYDIFCKKHNRVRNDWRTSIGVIERGAIKSINQRQQETNVSIEKIVEEKEIINNNVKQIPQIEFKEANTIKEAEEFVETNFEVKNCSFKGLSLENVNGANKQLTKIYNRFPKLKGQIKAFGTAQELNKMIKIRAKELLIDDFKKTYPNQKEWWDDWATKYSIKFASVVKTNTYAYHFTYAESDYSVTNILREEFKGIYLNKVMFKDDTIIKDYQQDLDNNFHPKGTTASSIIVHELGHALDDLIGLNDNKELNVYYKEVKNQIGTNLSRYAQTNIKEFLAEGFAEYIESSNPRPIAVAIGKFYEKVYNNYVEKVDRNDN